MTPRHIINRFKWGALSISPPPRYIQIKNKRSISNASSVPAKAITQPGNDICALSRLPIKTLLRSLVLASLMKRGWALRLSLTALARIEETNWTLLCPDRNALLNRLLRWTVYNHFCAGASYGEVTQSIEEVKKMGYQGVILGYAKEVVLDANKTTTQIPTATGSKQYSSRCYEMVDEWKNGNLETLQMIGPGDFLAVKLTGAGPISIDAMRAREPIPEAIENALHQICEETARQGSRLWLDAEQQILQPGLDEWAIGLMRKYSRDANAHIYNTIQAYLKGSKANLDRHMSLAAQEGWTLGIKLVRGAYIEHEMRSLIHDTKEDADQSYDLLADTLISQRLPDDVGDVNPPPTALFLATHNAASIKKAIFTHRQRLANNQPTVLLECGQVQGMADELSCSLLQDYEQCVLDPSLNDAALPRVFKYLAWGSVAECMGYLHRRAIENRGAVERTQHMLDALKREVRRRFWS